MDFFKSNNIQDFDYVMFCFNTGFQTNKVKSFFVRDQKRRTYQYLLFHYFTILGHKNIQCKAEQQKDQKKHPKL